MSQVFSAGLLFSTHQVSSGPIRARPLSAQLARKVRRTSDGDDQYHYCLRGSQSLLPSPPHLLGTGTVPGIDGDGGTSSCISDEGYSGSVVATSSAPYFTSMLTDQQATCSVSGSCVEFVPTQNLSYLSSITNYRWYHPSQGMNVVPGAGTCVCEPGYENTPVWSSPSWTNLDCTSPKQCPEGQHAHFL